MRLGLSDSYLQVSDAVVFTWGGGLTPSRCLTTYWPLVSVLLGSQGNRPRGVGRPGPEAEGLEDGWEGETTSLSSLPCAPDRIQQPQLTFPALSLPKGATIRRILPLPPWPGSATLDFELAGRKHLAAMGALVPTGV